MEQLGLQIQQSREKILNLEKATYYPIIYFKNEKLNIDWKHRSAKKAVMPANNSAEQVEGQRGEGPNLDAKAQPRREMIHASTQTTADASVNKKRKLADPECAYPHEQAENSLAELAALVAEMKQLVEARVSAEEDFKMKVDTLAQKILDLKFF
jgi:hypothetical protein